MNLEVANRLQQLRKAKGLSQEELANILGLSRQAISKWERAETSPDTDNLICLARLYNISIDKLLDTSESTEEIKERIAQERIKDVTDKNEETCETIEEIDEENCSENEEEVGLGEEEKELLKKADSKSGEAILAIFALSVIAYLIIGFRTSDWSWGWLLIIAAIFGTGTVIGLYEEKQFSIISFAFTIGISLVCIGKARDAFADSNSMIISYIVLGTISAIAVIEMVFYTIFAVKNRKDLEVIYHKKRWTEERKKMMEIVDENAKYKKKIDKIERR